MVNLFALLEGDEDASALVEAAKSAVKAAVVVKNEKPAQKVVEKNEGTVSNSRVDMRAKRLVVPADVVRSQHVGNSGQNNSNVHYSNNGYRGNSSNNGSYSNSNGDRGNRSNNGSYNNSNGYQRNVRGANDGQGRESNGKPTAGANGRYYRHNNNRGYNGGVNGHQGGSGDPYRNRSNVVNSVNNGGKIVDQMVNKGANLDDVDNEGWQIKVGRRQRKGFNGYANGIRAIRTDNEPQNGDHLQEAEHGDGAELNNGSIEEKDGEDEMSNAAAAADGKDLENVVDGEKNGSLVENKEPCADAVEATNDGTNNESNQTVEGETDSKGSKKKSSNKKQAEPSKNDKKQEKDDDRNKMTLGEYEKLQLEKRKALDSLKRSEQRRVCLDKDFESMQLVEKKTEDAASIKQNSEKDTSKKKENKAEKSREALSIIEFLKPAYARSHDQWRDRRPFGDHKDKNEGRSAETHPAESVGNGERPFVGGRGRGGRRFGGRGGRGERPYNSRGGNADRPNGGPNNDGETKPQLEKEKAEGIELKKPASSAEEQRDNGLKSAPAPAPRSGPPAAHAPNFEDYKLFPILEKK
ncbi:uncharacterized protein LOC126654787 [Mercurialis annua]|uniref:uncharacterized protein LOC126654787 n=1 Tax=Mercurialis annua TaxID=3986 RepID=UPI002160311B|nr:uncharacterized protein LOC126654787 [Mercurialis annua]